jgi:hypothetical protein
MKKFMRNLRKFRVLVIIAPTIVLLMDNDINANPSTQGKGFTGLGNPVADITPWMG